jgi:putative ABC transport system permease protein
MRFLVETFLLGLKNLRLHKLRSLLTALGIILGVAAVIIMVAIGEGGKHAAMEQMESMGATNIVVRSVKPAQSNDASQKQTRMLSYGIRRSDLARLETLPNLEFVVPLRDNEQKVVHGDIRATANAIGTTPELFSVMELELDRGQYFTATDYEQQREVCVLGAMAAQQLFPYADPIGESVRVGTGQTVSVMCRVVGVLRPTGLRSDGSQSSVIDRTIDQDVYFPLSVAQETFGDTIFKFQAGTQERKYIELSEVWLKARSIGDVERLALVAENTLRDAHGPTVDYEVKAPIQILRNAEKLSRRFTLVMGGTASIALLVGGIGIMNIMLASVTERTKEIGIRRALGAKQRHITMQFLVETTVLSLLGGLIGVGIGIGAAKALPLVVADYPTSVTTWSVAVSFAVAGLIGIGFGLYPAMTAARMNPIEALRHE